MAYGNALLDFASTIRNCRKLKGLSRTEEAAAFAIEDSASQELDEEAKDAVIHKEEVRHAKLL